MCKNSSRSRSRNLNSFNSIKSKETRRKYKSYLKKYMEITGINTTSLLSEKDKNY